MSPNPPADPNLTSDAREPAAGSDADWDQGLAAAFGGRAATIDYAPIAEQPGTKIGPYVLREQIGEGVNNVEHMKKDKDLDALRERQDFQKLLAELEAKAERKK